MQMIEKKNDEEKDVKKSIRYPGDQDLPVTGEEGQAEKDAAGVRIANWYDKKQV